VRGLGGARYFIDRSPELSLTFSEEYSQLESALRGASEPGRVVQLELLKQFGQFVQRLSSSLAS